VVDREGEGTDVFLVLHGHLRVVVSVGGRETILRDLKAGEFFGELAALDLKPRSAGILAIANSLLARMPAAAFRGAIHQHPDVCDQVLAVLVGQIRMLANRANEVSGLSMKPRLWAELLRLARPAASVPEPPVVSPPPTHAELAARVSSHREAVTRELNALERAGLIARRRGAIVLLDAAQLRRMVTEATEG
jgi:CRP-like cAMP-binding protein